MSTVIPYVIQHICLERLQHDQIIIDPELKYYCCFWWKEIPLGHLFIEKGMLTDTDRLQQKIWEAISPAIDHYVSKPVATEIDYRRLFLEKKHKTFSLAMESLLSDHRDDVFNEDTDITVIICTRNRSNDLQRCLFSLQEQICPPKEIIVVDNAPVDDSTFNVTRQFPLVVYCKELRGGLSIARNTGIRQAACPIIAFTDDDVTPHPFWLYHVKKSFCSLQVAAMTGLVIAASLKSKSQQLFEKNWSFNGGYRDKIYDNGYFARQLRTGPRVWDIGAGANMAFRKSAISLTGLFDERLGAGAAGCSEDSEIWFRILAKGFAIHYNPRAVVFHEHRKELEALFRQIFSYMKGHAVAALIQQSLVQEAGYRQYLNKKIVKGYFPLLIKRFLNAGERKLLLIQLHGLFAGIFFFYKNKNKPSNTNV